MTMMLAFPPKQVKVFIFMLMMMAVMGMALTLGLTLRVTVREMDKYCESIENKDRQTDRRTKGK